MDTQLVTVKNPDRSGVKQALLSFALRCFITGYIKYSHQEMHHSIYDSSHENNRLSFLLKQNLNVFDEIQLRSLGRFKNEQNWTPVNDTTATTHPRSV